MNRYALLLESKESNSLILGKSLKDYALDLVDALNASVISLVDSSLEEGNTIIIPSNMPLLKEETIKNIFARHEENNEDLTVISHIFVVKNNVLKEIKNLEELSLRSGGTTLTIDEEELFEVNNKVDLAKASKVLKERINNELMLSGVTLEDPDSTYISKGVKVGVNTIIRPNTSILGNSVIGENNVIGPNSYLENVKVGNNNQVISSYLTDTTIGNGNEVGPFTKMRAETLLEDNCRVGNFVELKNAHLHNGVKCAHLTYLGDASIGEKTNIGCMTVTANYDGYNKERTEIGKNVFIGSGSILIAPVTVEDEGFTAAGSTITNDVHKDDLAIARARQVNLPGGSSKFKAKAKAKKEAKLKK